MGSNNTHLSITVVLKIQFCHVPPEVKKILNPMKQKVTESDEIHSLTLGHETIDKNY